MVLQRIVKPKNQRVKRALVKREPKIHENDKSAILIRGGRTSETVTHALKDVYSLKKPLAVFFKKKNIIKPFEDQTSIEFFSNKCDASLFMFGSHSKKRPNNLIIGRLFDHHVLDMIELGINKFRSLKEFKISKFPTGTKPCLIFSGEPFENDHEHQRLKNLLTDFFRGPVVTNIRLAGLEHVIMFTAIDSKVFMRSYKILLKKSGSRIPRIELEEIGPSFDFVVRRTKLASDDLYKKARKKPKQAKPRKVKNMTRDVFGTKHGQIHMQKQDLDSLQLRKLKALKRKSNETAKESQQLEKETEPTEKRTKDDQDDHNDD